MGTGDPAKAKELPGNQEPWGGREDDEGQAKGISETGSASKPDACASSWGSGHQAF